MSRAPAIPPLVHYAVTGAREGRRPAPALRRQVLPGSKTRTSAKAARIRCCTSCGTAPRWCRDPHPLFSVRYYLAANPDIQAMSVDPLSHYMTFGSQKGLTPHPLFDPAFYLDHYPDAGAPGVNPLAHFVEHGARDGRSPHPLFDAKFYVKKYGDDAACQCESPTALPRSRPPGLVTTRIRSSRTAFI